MFGGKFDGLTKMMLDFVLVIADQRMSAIVGRLRSGDGFRECSFLGSYAECGHTVSSHVARTIEECED